MAGILSLFLGDEDFVVVVHIEDVAEVLLLCPLALYRLLVEFLYSPLVHQFLLLLRLLTVPFRRVVFGFRNLAHRSLLVCQKKLIIMHLFHKVFKRHPLSFPIAGHLAEFMLCSALHSEPAR